MLYLCSLCRSLLQLSVLRAFRILIGSISLYNLYPSFWFSRVINWLRVSIPSLLKLSGDGF